MWNYFEYDKVEWKHLIFESHTVTTTLQSGLTLNQTTTRELWKTPKKVHPISGYDIRQHYTVNIPPTV